MEKRKRFNRLTKIKKKDATETVRVFDDLISFRIEKSIKKAHGKKNASKDQNSKDSKLVIDGRFRYSTNSGHISVVDKTFVVEFASIKMFYSNGQIDNKQEIQFSDIPDDSLIYGIVKKNVKCFGFSLDATDRNVLRNRFTFSIKYSFKSQPNKFSIEMTTEIPYFQSNKQMQFEKIPFYHADEYISKMKHKLEWFDSYYRMSSEDRTKNFSYKTLKYALCLEDLAHSAQCDHLSMLNQDIMKIRHETYGFYMDKRCRMELKLLSQELSLSITQCGQKEPFAFKPFYVSGNLVCFRYEFRGKKREPFESLKFNIHFIPNSSSFRACYHALKCMKDYELKEFFEKLEVFPGMLQNYKVNNEEKLENFEWFDENISSNEEQIIAIKNVVNCTAYPLPYVIFGPPGTGKTSTLVECVAQIIVRKPTCHILISAQSNSACDEIGKRLMDIVPYNKIFRFLSSTNVKSTDKVQKSILNSQRLNTYPSYEELYHFNIVIITLSTSSRLVQAGVNENHFDYIFIDECGAASEPECLVPIIGLGARMNGISTNLVLLGDHKQLGPVLVSDRASNLGLSVSLLERIMLLPKYSNNPRYDNNYVVQLLDNYRNHPAILQFSNTEFYDSKLRSKISNEDKKFTDNFNFLTDKSFPIVFHSVLTPNEIEKYQTSSSNVGEIKVVKMYVDLLMKIKIGDKNVDEFDIGIVSPYKAQLSKLREAFKDLKNIEIGTAEYYQGREKRIIIITTVRSHNSVGFLKSEKRLNVMLTRAKSLLIIVGNPETLQKDKLWKQFINFCSQNNALAGEPFKQKLLTEIEEESVEKLTNALNQLKADAQESEDEEEEEEDEIVSVVDLKQRLMNLKM